MPANQAEAVFLPPQNQSIQWWNILLIVIGSLIVILLVAVLRVAWMLLNKAELSDKNAKPLSDDEFGMALANKVMPEFTKRYDPVQEE